MSNLKSHFVPISIILLAISIVWSANTLATSYADTNRYKIIHAPNTKYFFVLDQQTSEYTFFTYSGGMFDSSYSMGIEFSSRTKAGVSDIAKYSLNKKQERIDERTKEILKEVDALTKKN